MRRKCLSLLLIPSFVFLYFNHISFAATAPASQDMGGQERARQMQEEQEKLQNQVEQPTKAKPKEKPAQEAPEGPTAQRVLIKSINVTGVTLFPNNTIRSITGPYENKELTLKGIQKIADRITDLYRKKGYVISRAYIPVQTMERGNIEIMVIESKVGDILIRGNRYYSTSLLKSYLTIKKGEFFNYNDLKGDLENMNDHPDRTVKAVLVPGQEPGSTDVLLDVKDSLPVHINLGYNNYLSSFLRRNIYSSGFTDNNLLGHDDILNFEYERGDANDYYSYTTNYLYPITKSLDLGVYASRSEETLQGQFAAVDARGTSSMYGLYGSQQLIKNDSLTSHFNFGFDYKDVYNFLNGGLSSEDRLRIAKAGFDVNLSDDWGRTLITDEYDYGIPGIMGGTKRDLGATDTPTSRAGAGGQFAMDTLNILRLEELPYDSTLLWKNQLQFSNSKLTSTEQYQVGGPANNRGYSVADTVGDEGYSMSWELAQPPYFVPKSWGIPYTNTKIYDDFRFIEFYDWSNVHLNSLQPGDEKNQTLSSAGCGAKLNILKNLSASYEIAWPLMGSSSDGKGVHHWVEVTLSF
jgi:hemolysin activation/secretion protein